MYFALRCIFVYLNYVNKKRASGCKNLMFYKGQAKGGTEPQPETDLL